MAKLNLTMDAVLNDQRKAQHFYRFAKQQLCAENLDFLYAWRQVSPGLGVAVLRPVPVNILAAGGTTAARYLYDRFVLATGNHPNRVQVNLNSSTKTALDQAANQGTLGSASFNQAYQDVWNLILNDTWKKFAAPLKHQENLAKQYWDNNDLRGYIQY